MPFWSTTVVRKVVSGLSSRTVPFTVSCRVASFAPVAGVEIVTRGARAGFRLQRQWIEPSARFALTLFTAA